MTVIGTIEVTTTVDKKGRIYYSAWVEAGDRAVYLSDEDPRECALKAIGQFRRLTDQPNARFEMTETFLDSGPGVRFELSLPALKAVAS